MNLLYCIQYQHYNTEQCALCHCISTHIELFSIANSSKCCSIYGLHVSNECTPYPYYICAVCLHTDFSHCVVYILRATSSSPTLLQPRAVSPGVGAVLQPHKASRRPHSHSSGPGLIPSFPDLFQVHYCSFVGLCVRNVRMHMQICVCVRMYGHTCSNIRCVLPACIRFCIQPALVGINLLLLLQVVQITCALYRT